MQNDLNRRHFHQLTAAAFGGLLTGTLTGCPSGVESQTPATTGGDGGRPPEETETVSLLMQEPHVCRGLNMCKNKGRSKENACAGQGTCASVVNHDCAQQNECKGQGGCGHDPGENACKGKGGCHIPLMDHAWKSARKRFEEVMKEAGKNVGAAPEEVKS